MGWGGWVSWGGGGPHTIRRVGVAVLGQKREPSCQGSIWGMPSERKVKSDRGEWWGVGNGVVVMPEVHI